MPCTATFTAKKMPELRPKADTSFGDLEAVWWQVGGILKES